MTERVFGAPLDLHVTDEPVRARDVTAGTWVRAAGWSAYYATLGTEPLDGPGHYVMVMWRCDPGDEPPDAYTVFQADEWLAVKP